MCSFKSVLTTFGATCRHKQQGKAALDAHNVFYFLTYYGAVDLTQIKDEALRRATELQIAHFGQCPMQLFNRPHPARGTRVLIPRTLPACAMGMADWIEVRAQTVRRSEYAVISSLGVACGLLG